MSIATASKALNGREQVAETTRQRVLDAADRLAFSPNPLARGLLAGRTGTVGLLTSDLEGRFVIPILMGAEDAFGAGQVSVFLCDARGDTIREQHQLRALLSRRVDGLIIVGRQTDPRPSLGQDMPVPVVYAYAPSDDPGRPLAHPGQRRRRPDGRRAPARQRTYPDRAHQRRPRVRRGAGPRDRSAARRSRRPASSWSAEVMFSEWSESWGRDASALLLAQHPDVDADPLRLATRSPAVPWTRPATSAGSCPRTSR